jgi:hypothetical protein
MSVGALVGPLLLGFLEIELAAQIKRIVRGQLENLSAHLLQGVHVARL